MVNLKEGVRKKIRNRLTNFERKRCMEKGVEEFI